MLFDEKNCSLYDLVRPINWKDPVYPRKYDFVVVGSGIAGVTAAKECVALGARVALIE